MRTVVVLLLLGGAVRAQSDVDKVRSRVKKVAAELSTLGYPVDLQSVEVRVRAFGSKLTPDPAWSKAPRKAWLEHAGKWRSIISSWPDDPTPRAGLAHYIPWRKWIVFHQIGSFQLRTDDVIAHELVHAHQGQTRAAFSDPPLNYEKWSVLRCLTEGEAEAGALQFRLARAGRSLEDIRPASMDASFRLGLIGAGTYLPYQAGRRFIVERLLAGGREAVDRLYETPPSSEQILHPDKLGRDVPSPVPLPDPPAGAELLFDNTWGEISIYSFLAGNRGREEAFLAATGWDGDVARLYRMPDGKLVAIWRSVWDRDLDARQFKQSLQRIAYGLTRCRGRTVTWIGSKHVELIELWDELLDKRIEQPAADPGDAASTARSEERFLREFRPVREKEGLRWNLHSLGLSVPVPPGWWARTMDGATHLSDKEGSINVAVEPFVDGSIEALEKRLRTFNDEALWDRIRSCRRVEVAGRQALFVEHYAVGFTSRIFTLALPRGNELVLCVGHLFGEEQAKWTPEIRRSLLGITALPAAAGSTAAGD